MLALIGGLSVVQLCIYVVIVAACLALMYVALSKFGIAIPDWVIQCFWIVVVAMVVIFCIKLVANL